MTRLPRWAEKYFALQCSDGDAISTRPDEDENGWDYLVEFADDAASKGEDAPPPRKAFVQVKSTVGGGSLSSAVKLSNMHNACRSRDPWFLVLVAADKSGNVATYGRHIWSELIERTLARVREASLANVPLNRPRLSVRFTEQDRVDGNVVDWMLARIAEAGEDYASAKRALCDTAGYDAGHGTMTFTVEAESEEEMLRGFLGLGRGLQVKSFKYTKSRFGIPDPTPKVHEAGLLTVQPNPVDAIEVRVRGPVDEPAIALTGSAFVLGHAFAEESQRIRFSAPPLELIWRAAGTCSLQLTIDLDERHRLRHLSNYAKIGSWAGSGVLDVQVWRQGVYALGGQIDAQNQSLGLDTKLISDVVEMLARVAQATAVLEPELSMQEMIGAVSDLGYMAQFMSHGSLRFECDAEDLPAEQVTSLLYHTSATVADWTFRCIAKRGVVTDSPIGGGRRQVTGGPPRILQAYVDRNLTEDQAGQLAVDYQRILDALESSENPLSFGDIRNALLRTATAKE